MRFCIFNGRIAICSIDIRIFSGYNCPTPIKEGHYDDRRQGQRAHRIR